MGSVEEAQEGVALLEPEAPPTTQVYFHWAGMDSKGRSYPSSAIHHCSGGEKRVTLDGQAVITPVKDAHFHNGTFQTDDLELIAMLDRMCQNPGMCMTKDREIYYAHTMTAEERLRRGHRCQRESAVRMLAVSNFQNQPWNFSSWISQIKR